MVSKRAGDVMCESQASRNSGIHERREKKFKSVRIYPPSEHGAKDRF